MITGAQGVGGTSRRRLLAFGVVLVLVLPAALAACSEPTPDTAPPDAPTPTGPPTTPPPTFRPPDPLAPPETDETDPGRIAARAKIWTKYAERKRGFPTLDLRYYVDATKLNDFRWSQRALESRDPLGAPQLDCRWTDPEQPDALAIEVVVFKYAHKNEEAGVKYSIPFKHWGEAVNSSDMEKVVEGYYEDWRRKATDVVEEACLAPAKRKAGPAKMWAAVSATNPTTKEREYRVWYGWVDEKYGATYICRVRVGEPYLEQARMLDRSDDLVRAIKVIKDKIKPARVR